MIKRIAQWILREELKVLVEVAVGHLNDKKKALIEIEQTKKSMQKRINTLIAHQKKANCQC